MPKTEMMAFVEMLQLIGKIVEQTGDNREHILLTLEKKLGHPLEDDPIEIADAFLAGLRMTTKP